MLFNSLSFALFLPTVFISFWFLHSKTKTPRIDNLFLLGASYFFYACWDYRFLSLIVLSSGVDFYLGRKIFYEKNKKIKKKLLQMSLVVNLGILIIFKYCDFFIGSFVGLFQNFGVQLNFSTLQIILPVGLSFYTFQSLSYTIDVYNGKCKPTNDPIAFFTFVGFFPQLVAGPIERAKNLLPQFLKKQTFDLQEAKDGLRQILWGLFKKVAIADTVGVWVDGIFKDFEKLPGPVLLLGAILFSIQIYSDFSGYSDIAIGTAKLFGIKLNKNFNTPYFAQSLNEFWKRWHISLSSWFRDYVYIPLGGNRVSFIRNKINIFLTFTLSGLWHGANWTFVAWGFFHGAIYNIENSSSKLLKNKRPHRNQFLRFPIILFRIGIVFLLVSLGWILFRAPTITDAALYFSRMINTFWPMNIFYIYRKAFFYCLALIIVEIIHSKQRHSFDVENYPFVIRWLLYYVLTISIIRHIKLEYQPFIYFQF